MKNLAFWTLDKLLYALVVVSILLHENFSEFEKGVLILIVCIVISLNNIKDIIKSNSKASK